MLPLLPLLTAGAGIATSLYGINKQSKDQAASDRRNIAAAADADRRAWNNYLMQRGIYTGGTAAFGEIPGAQPGAPTNTRLPLWATLNLNRDRNVAAHTGRLVRRRTTPAPQPAQAPVVPRTGEALF